MNPRQEKTQIKNSVISLLKDRKSAKWDVLLASYQLETGFNEKTLSNIFTNMIKVGFIRVDKGIVTLVKSRD